MKLKLIVPVAVLTCVTAVLAFISVLAYQNAADTVNWAKQKQLSGIATLIEVFLREQGRRTAAEAELLAALPQVGEMAAAGDREGLKRMLMPGYLKATIKYGVTAGAVVTTGNVTILRLHDPEKFGDDQGPRRPILAFTNQTRDVQTGLEISSIAGIRGATPVYRGAVHVGVLEWATDLGSAITELKSITGADIAVMIRDSAIPAQSHARRNEARRVKDFIAVEATDWNYLARALQESDVERVNDTSFDTRSVGDIDAGVVKVPLFDFGGKNVGAIFAVKEIGEFGRTLKDTMVRLAVAGALGLLVTTCVVLMLVTGLMIRPLERLGERLRRLARGDFSTRVEGIGRRDEIGQLAGNIESVRIDLLRRFSPGSAPALAFAAAGESEAASSGKGKRIAALGAALGVIGATAKTVIEKKEEWDAAESEEDPEAEADGEAPAEEAAEGQGAAGEEPAP